MHDFGRVAWQSLPVGAVFFFDQQEQFGQFAYCPFGNGRQRVTSGNTSEPPSDY